MVHKNAGFTVYRLSAFFGTFNTSFAIHQIGSPRIGLPFDPISIDMYKNKIRFKKHAFFKFLALLLLLSPTRILAQTNQTDSLNIKLKKQLSELNIKFKTERKQKLIQQQQFAISRRNTTMAAIAALFAGVAIIGYQSYSRYRLKQVALLQSAMLHQLDIATQGIIEAEEKERKRIAANLHDGVGQLFSAVRMNLSSLMERVTLTNANEKALAEKTLAMVDESCREVRSIAHQMMPNILLKTGLASAIKDFVNKIDSQHLKINMEAYGLEERLDNNVEIVLYRVVQECVNNVIKHAHASRLDINLTREDRDISVTVEDNGIGFNTANKMKFEGIGLKNIITRVKYLKGSVDISSDQNKGTLVAIYIPLMV